MAAQPRRRATAQAARRDFIWVILSLAGNDSILHVAFPKRDRPLQVSWDETGGSQRKPAGARRWWNWPLALCNRRPGTMRSYCSDTHGVSFRLSVTTMPLSRWTFSAPAMTVFGIEESATGAWAAPSKAST